MADVSVNFYKGAGLPSTVPADGSLILNETDKTMWYSDGTKMYPLGGVNHYTVELKSDASYTESSGYYVYSLTVDGITAEDTPIADLYLENQSATEASDLLKEWNKVHRIETAANTITVYASAEITKTFKIRLKVIG